MRRLNDMALVEIKQQSSSASQSIMEEMGVKLESAQVGFQAEQSRLNALLEATQTRVNDLVTDLEAKVNTTVEKLAAASGGKLDRVAMLLVEQEAKFKIFAEKLQEHVLKQESVVDITHHIFRTEVAEMHASRTSVNHATKARLEQMERGTGDCVQCFDIGGGPPRGGARGYQIRIPASKAWSLTVLKSGEHGFLPWRKSFDLLV